MSAHHITAAPASTARTVGLVGTVLALGYFAVLMSSYLGGYWLINTQGQPIAGDFVNVWAAGRLALDGHAAGAYDWTLHKAAEVSAVGHGFDNYYGWHYPPFFLFAAAALAIMPYSAASLVWLIATLPGYLAAMRAIVGLRAGILLALGFPAALWNATAGQNGFLTASLIGGTLALMERHPLLAGCCLGLLTYKPHFGLLFPIVLIADKRWKVIAAASVVALALGALSLIVFGSETWLAFFEWMPTTSKLVLGQGAADWHRLQSIFGFVRAHGGGQALAWAAQGAVTLTLAAALVWLWRTRAAFELKAAALSAAALLATPYVYTYDLVALAIPVAYLVRIGLTRGFIALDVAGLIAASALLLAFPFVNTNVGLAATLVVVALIASRVWVSESAET
ncbi:MAG TPA: glycosyltransferase family 87 protein [Pseudolabrys sp.]|nr:glycosyltransferase family 87 protein [Pseudolabrys sp.]